MRAFLINLKIFLSCLSHFFLSGKYPLDILYSRKKFTPRGVLVKFGARASMNCYQSARARKFVEIKKLAMLEKPSEWYFEVHLGTSSS